MKLLILLTVFLNLTSNNAFAGNWNNSTPQDNTKFVTDENYTDFFESKAQYTDFKRWIEKAFKSQSSVRKHLTKFKNNQAYAACTEWQYLASQVLNGKEYLPVYAWGEAWNYNTKQKTVNHAVKLCNEQWRTSGCKCEPVLINREFVYPTGAAVAFKLESLEAEKRKTEQLQQELAALQAKQASAQPVVQESSSSAVAVVSSPEQSTVSVSSSSTKWRNAKTPQEAQAFANDIQSSIVMFMAIADVIKKQPASLKDRVLGVVDGEIARLRAEKELLQQQLSSRFSTPIRPSNANLSVSAFRAADTFPKIPFYVPGTNEIGEMLVIPRVTDDGFLSYKFDFLDPTATYNKVRDTISIPHKNVNSVITGLQKVDEWTKVAQENNINRRVEKSAACVPEGKCEDKKQGISSTEVMFQIYEDGSTAGRIQRNKGKFSVGYNMSVESSILLSAYLTYMRDVGAKEFNIGVMSDDEVKKLFN